MLDLDADHIGHRGGVDKVDIRRAELAVVVIFPVFHEDADDLVPLLLEQISGDGRIHAATQPHYDALFNHGAIIRRGGFRLHRQGYAGASEYRSYF